MKIRVPKKITKTIEELAGEICPGSRPVYIDVDNTLSLSDEDDCFANVAKKMMADGGDFQFGWAVWEWPEVMLEAEFWAVWVNGQGQWVDVTPRARGEKVLFIADNETKPGEKPIDSLLKPIMHHPLVLQYIEISRSIWQKTDELTAAGKDEITVCERIAPMAARKEELEKEIEKTIAGGVGRNDRCSCGSGKKFKNCCGH